MTVDPILMGILGFSVSVVAFAVIGKHRISRLAARLEGSDSFGIEAEWAGVAVASGAAVAAAAAGEPAADAPAGFDVGGAQSFAALMDGWAQLEVARAQFETYKTRERERLSEEMERFTKDIEAVGQEAEARINDAEGRATAVVRTLAVETLTNILKTHVSNDVSEAVIARFRYELAN